jgi:hypothetical protein
MFREYDVVLIRVLESAHRHVEGTEHVRRQPRVGDRGAIVEIAGPNQYSVECVDHGGRTIWLADFSENELALPPDGWEYTVTEVSAGVYQAVAVGPCGIRAEATSDDELLALASCREFALRYPSGPSSRGAG